MAAGVGPVTGTHTSLICATWTMARAARPLKLALWALCCAMARGAFEPVRELSSLNFNGVVSDPTSAVLVAFVAPWCPHSNSLRPSLDALGRHLSEGTNAVVAADVVVARCDATLEPDLASQYGVVGYPTLVWFPKGGGKPEPYRGAETTAAMAAWAEERAGLVGAAGYRPYREPAAAAVALTAGSFDAFVYDPRRLVGRCTRKRQRDDAPQRCT